jgi:hypothetical protein
MLVDVPWELELTVQIRLRTFWLIYEKTENAANRIKELLSGESAKGAIGIRLGTKKRELYNFCCIPL